MRSVNITVGVCACGDERNLAPLLDNILHEQGLPASSEVLVVCSECTKETVDTLQGLMGDRRLKASFEDKRTGKAAAMNKILSDAKGEFIIFVSADVLPKGGCFQKLLVHMKEGVGIACGQPIPVGSFRSTTGRLVQLLWRFHHRMFAYLNHAGLLTHVSEVYCMRSGVTGPIPANAVNDDAYMAVMARKGNWAISYEPDAQVVIRGPDNVLDYFEQRRRIVFGHYQVRGLTGRFPQYLVYWALLRPTKVLKLVLEEMGQERNLRIISTAFILELLVNLTGILDFLIGKSHIPWRVISSTKRAFVNPTARSTQPPSAEGDGRSGRTRLPGRRDTQVPT